MKSDFESARCVRRGQLLELDVGQAVQEGDDVAEIEAANRSFDYWRELDDDAEDSQL